MRDLRWTIDNDAKVKVSVLLIEDNESDIKLFKDILRKRIDKDIHLEVATSYKSAQKILAKNSYDVIFLDLNLPDCEDEYSFSGISKMVSDIPIIILSGIADVKIAMDFVSQGAQDYIVKGGYNEDTILKSIHFATRRKALLTEKKNLNISLQNLLANIELGVVVINNERRILFASERVQHHLGLSPAELTGKKFALPFDLERAVESDLSPYGKPGEFARVIAHASIWENQNSVVISIENITEKRINRIRLKSLDEIRMATKDINQLIVRTEDKDELIFESMRLLGNCNLFSSISIYFFDIEGNKYYLSSLTDTKSFVKTEVDKNYLDSKFNITNIGSEELYEISINDSGNDVVYVKSLNSKIGSLGALIVESHRKSMFSCEEKELIIEIGDDLGYALYNMNMRKELKEQIKENEAKERRFKEFFEQSLTGNFISSADGQLIDCNAAYLKIFGFSSKEEALKYDLGKLYPEFAQRDVVLKMLDNQKVLKGYELEMTRLDGSKISIEANVRGEYDDDGNLKSIIGHIHDVSEKKKALQALIESENKFRKLSENLPVAVLIVNKNKLLYANKFAGILSGYSLDELKVSNIWGLLKKSDAERIKKIFDSGLLSLEQFREYDLELTTKQNTTKWVDITAAKMEFGCESAILITAVDVSERQRAENEVMKLSQAIHQTPVAVMITDTEGQIEYVNNHFTYVYGYSGIEALGKYPSLLKSGETPNEVFAELWKTIKAGESWKGELINKAKDGSLVVVNTVISPIRNRKGKITNYVSLQEDVTELKNMIDELVRAREAAEKANRMKSEFIAQISHEIRTPLNPIMCYNDLIREELKDKLPDNFPPILESVDRAVKRLLRTLDLLIFNSELNVGSYDGEMKKLNLLYDILQPIHDEYNTLALSKGIDFKINCEKDIELFTDEGGLKQILINLADNAIKYTNEGKVEITAEQNIDSLKIKVSDTGIGIAKEYLPELFSPFSQEDSGYTRKYEGTGLGLSLVKKLCDRLGIVIDVESEKGKGTEITLNIKISGDQPNG